MESTESVVGPVAQDQLWSKGKPEGFLSQAAPQFLCPKGLRQVTLSRSSGLTCVHRFVHTPGRLAIS